MATDDLVADLRSALDDRLVGVYLVDDQVVVATEGRLSPDQRSALPVFDGVAYAPTEDLRSPMTLGRRWPTTSRGRTTLSALANTARTRWVLRERATALVGPPAPDLVAEVSPASLRAEALGEARRRAEAFDDDPDPRAWTVDVLEGCRLTWIAAHATVAGTSDSASFVLERIDAVHHDVVRAALTGAPEPGRAATRAFVWDVVRLSGTWALEARGR